MEYKKKDVGAYRLHLVKTNRFKTITFQIVFRRPIVKEEITIRNVLTQMLTQSCAKYQSKRELAIYSQELYGAYVESSNYRLGNYLNTNFFLTILNEKYTEEGMLEKSISFLHDILFSPHVEGEEFNEESFDYVIHNTKSSIESMKENTSKYSIIRLLEVLEENSPLSYRSYGYLEDLENITRHSLYEHYLEMIKNDMVDILVIGDIDFEEMTHLMKQYFDFATLKQTRRPALIECNKCRRTPKMVTETEDLNQSKLAIGCRLVKLQEYERNYPLTLFNIIFGGSSDSKLFQEVREKNSLAYTVRSVPNKLDSLLLITAGIDAKMSSKAIEIIKKQLKEMQKGHFSEEDIKKAKEYFETVVDEAMDAPGSVLESYYTMELLGTDDLETKKAKMWNVTKEEIVKVAKHVKIDTIYLLEGEEQ